MNIPNDLNAEKSVLGSIMYNQSNYDSVADILSDDLFFDNKTKLIYQKIKGIYSKEGVCDFILLMNEVKNEGIDVNYLLEIQNLSSINFYQYALLLKQLNIERNLLSISTETISKIGNDDIDEIITSLRKRLDDLSSNEETKMVKMDEAVERLIDHTNKIANGLTITGYITGFREFDKFSGGLHTSDLIVLAGETSQGKTTLALSIIKNIAFSGVSCAIYSLEMSLIQLTARIASGSIKIPSKTLLYQPLQEKEYILLDRNIGKIAGLPIYIDQKSINTIDSILSSIRLMATKYGVKVFMIDYLQLVKNPKIQNNELAIADICRSLKNLAKEVDVNIILLSQLARDRDNVRPSLSRLRGSGQIEEAADVVMFAYRPEYYHRSLPEPFESIDPKGMAFIDIAKGRNIGIFSFITRFSGEYSCFYDIDNSTPLPQIENEKSPF